MQLNIFNIDDFVKANHCLEVTNPVFFSADKNPTPDGLFSYDIFGITDDDRKNRFAYVDLHGHYIHPLIYAMMTTRMGSIRDILSGEKYAVLAAGKINIVDRDTAGAKTGVDFLYNNYEHIDWINEIDESEIDSVDKKTRLKFLKSIKKDEFFVDKWLVLPPFYRAENSEDRTMGDVVNKLYKELISRTRSMKVGFSYDLFGNETKMRIQELLKEIYFTTLTPASGKTLVIDKGTNKVELRGSGKNSLIRNNLLGKALDWSASNVITSPVNSLTDSAKNKPVPFGYSAFPLATLVSLFQPFFVSYGTQFMEYFLYHFKATNANNIKSIDLGQFNSDAMQKLTKKYIKASENRFSPIEISYVNLKGKTEVFSPVLTEYKTQEDVKQNINGLERPMTLTDLIYIIAKSCLLDKHVYVVRYPVADFQNIYPCKIKILTTNKTRKLYVTIIPGAKDYLFFDDYPTIAGPGVNSIDSSFFDVMLVGNAYLDQMGADYDGDTVYMKAVFTKEANAEAEKLVWSKTNLLTASGAPARGLEKIGKECVMGLYELTKEVK
jgi:DNA-directed RNA polymerase beta' subunit